MDRRSAATPMEFEYDNKTGRVDTSSAWLNAFTPKKQADFRSQPSNSSFSPQKQSSPTRSHAYPNPQTPIYKAPPLMPFHGIRDTPTQDFSSGPENQSSPENADNEDTPEPWKAGSKPKINDNVTVFRGHKTPSRRSSFFGSFDFRRFSPGRSGLRKRQERDALTKKVRKRKRWENETEDRIERRRSSDESGSDTRSGQDRSAKPVPQERLVIALLHAVMKYPSLPFQLLTWAQLMFNIFILFLLGWIIWSFYLGIQDDVKARIREEARAIMSEAASCSSHFLNNRCNMENRVPAMEPLCENWAHCMARAPDTIGGAKITAIAFGEIYSSLIDPISTKALTFTLTVITLIWVVPNVAFLMARDKIFGTSSKIAKDQGSSQHDQARYDEPPQYLSRQENDSRDLVPLNYNGSRSPSKSHGYR
ncbi:hypothetical protein MMC32_000480 [Xylographa parallela]|nr:hypothetical protein [Xylographa parallela]